jgi:hypothetical protein
MSRGWKVILVLFLTLLVWVLSTVPEQNVTTILLFPGYMIGAIFTGNAHAPSEVIAWAVTALELYLILSALEYVLKRLSGKRKSGNAAS